jgi:hypothetical protein
VDRTPRMTHLSLVPNTACTEHPAYEADNCPSCGTARRIGGPTVVTFRTNADGSLVCPHRDLSVCPACLAQFPDLMDVFGAVYLVTDPAERAELAALVNQ